LICRSGRRFDADQIVLDVATVSRYHALLLRHADGLLVDLESTNGTFVNKYPYSRTSRCAWPTRM
jgi:pSer/pThr/pTyr-binding forkhead associated (FHA) protein